MARHDPQFRSGPPAVARTDPPALPAEVDRAVGGGAWEQVWVREDSEVWRVTASTADTADVVSYLKIGAASGRDSVVAERDRLMWLAGRQSTPTVLAHHVEGGTAWLLTSEVTGIPAHDPRFRMGSMQPWLQALGRSLRRFHDELAVASCPFDARLEVLLAEAQRRVAAGGIDPSLMPSTTYRRHTAEQLLHHLLAMRPIEPEEDLVVAHGDPCLPNLLMSAAGDQVTGLVDLGRVGVSDRYRDIAIIVRSVSQNIGPEVTYVMLDAYGMPNPDLHRLEFYVLLDEMW